VSQHFFKEAYDLGCQQALEDFGMLDGTEKTANIFRRGADALGDAWGGVQKAWHKRTGGAARRDALNHYNQVDMDFRDALNNFNPATSSASDLHRLQDLQRQHNRAFSAGRNAYSQAGLESRAAQVLPFDQQLNFDASDAVDAWKHNFGNPPKHRSRNLSQSELAANERAMEAANRRAAINQDFNFAQEQARARRAHESATNPQRQWGGLASASDRMGY